jgi:branched-chain amino acid transport system substrate-binding protein
MKPFSVFTLTLALLGAASGPSQADIVIATAGPMSGQYEGFGQQIARGAQAAVDDINAAGGLNGERLVLEVADDGCEPKKAVEVANALVAKGIAFMAGHFCSFASIPAAPVYAAAGIVMISPAATNPKFTEDGAWNTLRIVPRDDAQGTFAGRYLASRFPNAKIAAVDDGTPFGQSLTANMRKALQEAGRPEPFSAAFKTGEKNFADLVGRLKAAAVEVVYAGGYHPELGLLAREMRNQGLTALLVSADTLVTDEFGTIAGEAAEGTLMTFPIDAMSLPSAASAVRRFQDNDVTPEGHTLHAYAAVQAWAEAVKATGGTDGRRIADWLHAGNTVNTLLGPIAFDAKGDLKSPEFAWYRWKDGRFVQDETIR